MTDSGMTEIEAGRCGDGCSMEDRAGAARFRGGGGIPAVTVQNGGEKVARKLLRIDVVLVVSLVRAKRGWSVRTMVRPSGGGGQDCRRSVLAA
jgi:hypothetical protein